MKLVCCKRCVFDGPFFRNIMILYFWLVATILAVSCLAFIAHYFSPEPLIYSEISFPYQLNPRNSLHPFHRTFPENFTVLLDGHSHTTLSDGKLSPRQLAEWAVASGYNAIFVTDHNTVSGALAVKKVVEETPHLKDKLVVLSGMEYTCCRVHMNLLNIKETIPPCGLGSSKTGCPFATDDHLKLVIDQVHELGGWAVVNHIPWSTNQESDRQAMTLPTHPTLERLIELGIDAVEVINQNIFDLSSLQLAEKAGLGIITGSDIHYPTKPFAWTILNPQNFTEESIWDELKKKKNSFLFDASGLKHIMPSESFPRPNRLFSIISPFSGLMNFFSTTYFYLDSGQYSFQMTFCHKRILKFDGVAITMTLVYIFLIMVVSWGFRNVLAKLFRLATQKIKEQVDYQNLVPPYVQV